MIKKLFLKQTIIYKISIIAILSGLLLNWAFSLNRNYKRLKLDLANSSDTLQIQDQWLQQESDIKQRLESLLKAIDPKKTYEKTKFLGYIDEIARSSMKTFSLDIPQTKSGDTFDSHTLKLKTDNASIQELVQFEQIISSQHPYISIEEVKINANSSNPHKLNAQFSLVAIQLKTNTK